MAGLILLLALAIGISMVFYYAARAAFKADSRERKRTNELFAYLERTFKGESDDPGNR